MTQTFIDMLVAIKDPVAIEKAYNILAAKRALFVVGAGKGVGKSTFQHSVMEPKPVSKPKLKDYQIDGGDYVEIKGATPDMQAHGFYNGELFLVNRRYRYKPKTHVVATCCRTGLSAVIHVDYLYRINN